MWEAVATFDTPLAADAARNHLVAHGIDARLEEDAGVIRLSVGHEHVGRALETLEGHATREAEPFDDTPTDLAVDRLFRVAVVGLLFPPAQVIALWLAARLWGASPRVRSRDRWKVAASLLLNLPLWLALWLLACAPFLAPADNDPNSPHWRAERFAGMGDHAVTLELPNPYGFDIRDERTLLGPAKVRSFDVNVGPERFGIVIKSVGAIADPPTALNAIAEHEYRDRAYAVQSITPTAVDGHPATEITAVYTDPQTHDRRVVRQTIIALPGHLVYVSSNVPENRRGSEISRRFFESLRTE